jgi:MbtH protein
LAQRKSIQGLIGASAVPSGGSPFRSERFGQESEMDDLREDDTQYSVVMNAEEQYSIWPEGREMPLGWKAAGKSGTKAECLAYIEEVWTDMRPLSLRRQADTERDRAGR